MTERSMAQHQNIWFMFLNTCKGPVLLTCFCYVSVVLTAKGKNYWRKKAFLDGNTRDYLILAPMSLRKAGGVYKTVTPLYT